MTVIDCASRCNLVWFSPNPLLGMAVCKTTWLFRQMWPPAHLFQFKPALVQKRTHYYSRYLTWNENKLNTHPTIVATMPGWVTDTSNLGSCMISVDDGIQFLSCNFSGAISHAFCEKVAKILLMYYHTGFIGLFQLWIIAQAHVSKNCCEHIWSCHNLEQETK